ncbi:hypothetical protein ACS0TY_029389 [Phlomoides rotata]
MDPLIKWVTNRLSLPLLSLTLAVSLPSLSHSPALARSVFSNSTDPPPLTAPLSLSRSPLSLSLPSPSPLYFLSHHRSAAPHSTAHATDSPVLQGRNKDLIDGAPTHAPFLQRKQISVWLKSFNHSESDNILKYELENVVFTWKTKKTDLDCGIFLMNHMEFFEGDVYYTPDLGKALVRRALKASYYARIVVSDVNRKKLGMQKKVAAFCERKPLLMEMETNKKRAEVELKAKKKKNSSTKN